MASAHSRRLLTFSVATAALLLLSASIFIFHVHQTLTETSRSVADSHHLPFSFGPLALPPNPGFEPIAAPAAFTSAATLDGHIFVAGASALNVYNSAGTLERSFHVGLDLPPAPLNRMIVARLRGQSQPQLLIATAGAGILLYDTTTQSFRQLLPASADLRDITALAALGSGELLAGTRRHGLLVYNSKTLELFRPEYAEASITTLLTAGNDVWAGTQNHGLFHTHAGITDHFESELPDPHVETLAAEGNRIFAATPLGVELLEDGRPSRTVAPNTFAQALFADSKTLTLSTLTEGATTVALDSTRVHTSFTAAGNAEPTEQFLTLPGSDDLYAVRHDGLYRRTGSRWVAVLEPAKAALTDNNIAALGFAPDGRLWVGYFDRGLDVMSVEADPTITTARHLEDDHLFCINRIALDPVRNTMAVATANGLVLFDATGKPRQVLTRRDGLISDHVTDVVYSRAASGDARMTIATPAGLTFVDNTGIQSLYAFQGLVNNHVYTLAASADGNELLAGTLGGVSLLTHDPAVGDRVRRNLTVSNSGLRHNWITAALPTDGGYMVGTYGAGVMRLDASGHFSSMDLATRNMVINPNAMLSTPTHIFAGSLNQGLWIYSRAAQRWTQITSGLPSLNVTALATQSGTLYVGTQNGLVRIAESKLPQ